MVAIIDEIGNGECREVAVCSFVFSSDLLGLYCLLLENNLPLSGLVIPSSRSSDAEQSTDQWPVGSTPPDIILSRPFSTRRHSITSVDPDDRCHQFTRESFFVFASVKLKYSNDEIR